MFAVAPRNSVSVEIAASLTELAALRPEWTALWARDPQASPFQHPAWVLPWARTHAPDRTGAALVREDGVLVGLAPVFRWRGAVYLAATGPSDRCDVLVAPGRDDVAAGLLAAVCGEASAHACARVDLKQLPPGSAWLEAPTPTGWRSRIEPGDVCPVAALQGPKGLAAMPGKWRRKLGYTRRRAEALGGYAVETAAAATLGEHQAALERLHADRWRERGEAGVLGGELQAALVREALPELERDGLLRLYALRHQGEIAGVVLALQAHATLYFYACGFDPERSELGAGTLLIAHAMSAAAAEGAAAADFLRGRERYKYHWGALDTPTFRRVLER